MEGHRESSIISGGGHAFGGTHTSCGLDTGLNGTGGGLGSTVGGTLAERSAKDVRLMDVTGHLGLSGIASSAHEERDHLGSINWSITVGSAKSGGLAGADLV